MRLKTKVRLIKREEERFPEGRGNKRKMQACLNSQVLRKV